MANKPLKSIQFPGLDDTYTVPQVDSTLAVSGAAADAKKTGDEIASLKEDITELDTALESKANIDGSYDTMTVGNAKQLTSNVGINDKAPYLFRTAGGANDIGDREEDTIVGGSIVWNQYAKVSSMSWPVAGYNGIYVTKVDDETVHVSGTATANAQARAYYFPKPSSLKDHVCYVKSGNSNVKAYLGNMSSNHAEQIGKPTTSPDALTFYISNGTDFGENGIDIKPKIVDLTAVLGTAITDYIMTITPMADRVAWLKRYFMLDKDYPYCEPTFKHVEGLASHKMTGFNQFDINRTKGTLSGPSNTTVRSFAFDKYYVGVTANNYYYESQISSFNVNAQSGEVDVTPLGRAYGIAFPLRCFPNTSYYIKATASAHGVVGVGFYDINGRHVSSNTNVNGTAITTPSNCYIMTVVLGSDTDSTASSFSDICISLHWDGERDGEYEAYKEYTYPLDDSLTLRGIPKLDANNDLYYDGDTYEADGTVTRKYGIVDLGTLAWGADSNRTGVFYATLIGVKGSGSIISDTYVELSSYVPSAANVGDYNKRISTYPSYGGTTIYIIDHSFDSSTGAQVGTALDGKYAVYELTSASQTTESADPFQTPQVVDDWGTEEYVYTDGAFPIPVGHDTFYAANLKAKLEMAPDSPGDGDGDYVVRQTNGLNEYVKMTKELPSAPTTDGSYHLGVTVASGTPTLTWVADE